MNSKPMSFLDHFNSYLLRSLEHLDSPVYQEVLNYALNAPGKRFRPLLVEACVSEKTAREDVCVLAAALEMIHTYSLVHDDLPALDNDDLRRGRLTVHKQFDEALAILAGDGLLSLAFEHILNSALNDDLKLKALSIIGQRSGVQGMIYGQILDMYPITQNPSLEDLIHCYHHKTGDLFAAALQLGALFQPQPIDQEVLKDIGYRMGLAFQIQDDYLEAVSDTETLGKSNQSDFNNQKMTVVRLLGVDATRAYLEQLFDELNHAIMNLPFDTTKLVNLLGSMQSRKF